MRTRVKICGITRPQDALAAAQAGADAIGLVFYEKSPRYVPVREALAIWEVIPPFISVVGLFVNAGSEKVNQVLEALPLDLLQFHGNEAATECEQFGRPYIKAIGMRESVDIVEIMQAHPRARGFLLDAYQPQLHGGGGVAFDWRTMPQSDGKPLILAGGLTPENVSQAIALTRPFAVDVSSGVEREKGIKSAQKIQAFIRGVERGDESQASE